mmetsp:Transcript_24422/g.68479  ORF Transcript_24422/g.68479 Transcript_24422/m.68479 type:complete len:112 (+) Transcript_24422:1261-1596(+)
MGYTPSILLTVEAQSVTDARKDSFARSPQCLHPKPPRDRGSFAMAHARSFRGSLWKREVITRDASLGCSRRVWDTVRRSLQTLFAWVRTEVDFVWVVDKTFLFVDVEIEHS